MCWELKQSIGSWTIYSSTADCAPSTYPDFIEEEPGNNQPSSLSLHTRWPFPELPWSSVCTWKRLLHPHHSYSPLCSLCRPDVWRSIDWSFCLFCTSICYLSQKIDFRGSNSLLFGVRRQQGEVDFELKIPLRMFTSNGLVCVCLEDWEASGWTREFKGIMNPSPTVTQGKLVQCFFAAFPSNTAFSKNCYGRWPTPADSGSCVSASQAVGVLVVFRKANNRKYAESYNMKLKFRPSGSCSSLADLSKPLLYFFSLVLK